MQHNRSAMALITTVCLSWAIGCSLAFSPHFGLSPISSEIAEYAPRRNQHPFRLNVAATSTTASEGAPCHETTIPITLDTYEYDNWKLTYRYKPPSPGYEAAEPLVLIHPVGIGTSSWFWTKFMEEWKGGPVYAPNLIGCGLEDGNDAWDPEERGMSVPLAWVKAVEALIQERVLMPPRLDGSQAGEEEGSASDPGIFGRFLTKKEAVEAIPTPPPCIVVVQGGCAPIGVLLASRNPTSVVSRLVLTSPPTWDDLVTATPKDKLEGNYNFYRSNVGKLAFNLLESPWAVRLFSNLFLFLEECDDRWIELSTDEQATTIEARPPVAIFNSGFLQHRSYEEELRELEQPTLILSGSGDKRAEKRKLFGSEMKHCTLTSVKGTNVLPWEVPEDVCEAIQAFTAYS
mmetsp:Transcript_13483/g.29286  ORF Transcript_13483/g.29286 Transcript_13483/m.29286 type:complete len:402 (-) Transcript_13483:51-1256(-)